MISYHPRKANVVADALSRKTMGNLAALITQQRQILENMRKLELEVRLHNSKLQLANMRIQMTLIERIKAAQNHDSYLLRIKESLGSGD